MNDSKKKIELTVKINLKDLSIMQQINSTEDSLPKMRNLSISEVTLYNVIVWAEVECNKSIVKTKRA